MEYRDKDTVNCQQCQRVFNSKRLNVCPKCGTSPETKVEIPLKLDHSDYKFCYQCGSTNRKVAKFCEVCGVLIEVEYKPNSTSISSVVPSFPVQETRVKTSSKSTEKKARIRFDIGGKVLVAIFIAAGFFWILGSEGNSGSSSEETSSYENNNSSQESSNFSSQLSLSASLKGRDLWGRQGQVFLFEVTNLGNDPIAFFGTIEMITDGRETYLGVEATRSNELKYVDVTLNPKSSVTFTALFDAPIGTNVSKFRVVQGTDDGTDGVLAETPYVFEFPSE